MANITENQKKLDYPTLPEKKQKNQNIWTWQKIEKQKQLFLLLELD